MIENIWQKIKKNHSLLMVLCCAAPIILVIVFFALFKGDGNWTWLFILLCPLMHIFMMKGHGGHNSCEHKEGSPLYQCPECGLEYEEEGWAKKCEAWCKKFKSCNLEITKYAIKKGREINN